MSLPISKYLEDLRSHKERYMYVSNIVQKLPDYSIKERSSIIKSLKLEIVKKIEADCVKDFYTDFMNLNL